MSIKKLLLGSGAMLFAVTGARAADAVEVVSEPEPVEYVRVCDTYGAGYFYIPGTETCLRIGGYIRYDIGAGSGPYGGRQVEDKTDGDENDTYYKNARFNLKTWTGTETELGTLSTYTETRWNWGSDSAGEFDNKGTSLNFAWIQLGGFRVGKDESAWATFSGYAGGVIADDLIPFTLYDTNLVSYTFDAGNGFSAVVSLETGQDNVGDYWGGGSHLNGSLGIHNGDYAIDSYIPHVVGGVKYAGGWGSASVTGAYDSAYEVFAVKGRIDVNVNEQLSLFVMGAWGETDEDEGIFYSYYKPWNGNWAAWGGASYKFSDKATFNVQASYAEGWDEDLVGSDRDGGDFAVAVNVDYELVKDFHIIPEITYTDYGLIDEDAGFGSDDDEGFAGFLRFQRNF